MRSVSDSPRQLFRHVCQLLLQGDASARALLPGLESFPEYGEGWLLLGDTLLRLKQPKAADVAFDHALAAPATPVAAMIGKADVLVALDQPGEAARLLDANQGRWPEDAAFMHRLGRAHYAAGALRQAKAALTCAVQLDPGLAEAWFRLGLVAQDLGDEPTAVSAYRNALAARPAMYEAALNLGISLQDMGDIEAAMTAYGMAVRLQPACFNRVAQALTSGSTGRLWLDLSVLRGILEGRA